MIYRFVFDLPKDIVNNIRYALARPKQNYPPIKKHNLSLTELTILAIFRGSTRIQTINSRIHSPFFYFFTCPLPRFSATI